MQWPFQRTETDKIIDTINRQANANIRATSDAELIKFMVDQNRPSGAIDGVKYYDMGSDVTKRVRSYVTEDGGLTPDTKGVMPNSKTPHGFYPLLIKQKINFLLGKKPKYSAEEGNEALQAEIDKHTNRGFDKFVRQWARESSKKGSEWLHPYVDDTGNFKRHLIPGEEFIPIYDASGETLEAGIHYYTVTDSNGHDVKYATLYKLDARYHYVSAGQGADYIPDHGYPGGHRQPYHYDVVMQNGEVIERRDSADSWSRLPLIELANNDERTSDLHMVRGVIDDYDFSRADSKNTLRTGAENSWFIMGAPGTTGPELARNLTLFRAASLPQGASIEAKQNPIPIEAQEANLNRLWDEIFTFGMGVDVRPDKFGTNPSGEALKNIYSLLNLKVDDLEQNLQEAVEQYFYFFQEYQAMYQGIENKEVEVQASYVRSEILNLTQRMDALTKSLASDETKLENDPFVDDPAKELERKKAESAQKMADAQKMAYQEPTNDPPAE